MFFTETPILLIFLCRFQVFLVEQYSGSTLNAFLKLNGAKTREEDGNWINFAKTEEFISESCIYEFT